MAIYFRKKFLKLTDVSNPKIISVPVRKKSHGSHLVEAKWSLKVDLEVQFRNESY